MKRPTYEGLLKIAEVLFEDDVVHKIWERPCDWEKRNEFVSNCGKVFRQRYLASLGILMKTAGAAPFTFCPDCWSDDEIEEAP